MRRVASGVRGVGAKEDIEEIWCSAAMRRSIKWDGKNGDRASRSSAGDESGSWLEARAS